MLSGAGDGTLCETAGGRTVFVCTRDVCPATTGLCCTEDVCLASRKCCCCASSFSVSGTVRIEALPNHVFLIVFIMGLGWFVTGSIAAFR